MLYPTEQRAHADLRYTGPGLAGELEAFSKFRRAYAGRDQPLALYASRTLEDVIYSVELGRSCAAPRASWSRSRPGLVELGYAPGRIRS